MTATPLWVTILVGTAMAVAAIINGWFLFRGGRDRLGYDLNRAKHQDANDKQKNRVDMERFLEERIVHLCERYDKQIGALESQLETMKQDHFRDVQQLQSQLQDALIQLDSARKDRDQRLEDVKARDKQIASLQERIASLENAPHLDSVTVKMSRPPILSEMSQPSD